MSKHDLAPFVFVDGGPLWALATWRFYITSMSPLLSHIINKVEVVLIRT
jgi:hypothetical protein